VVEPWHECALASTSGHGFDIAWESVTSLPAPRPDEPPFGLLERELALWAAAGRVATLWWRDDDAVAPTPALDRLARLAGNIPVALAVIPAPADPALKLWLDDHPSVTVIQHGWSHVNHGARSIKKIELGGDRPADAVLAELEAGRRRLAALYGRSFRAVLTPPWNRIDDALIAPLPAAGFVGLSVAGPRARRCPVDGLVQVNTHVDPVAWHAGRGFRGAAAALGDLTGHLALRRTGAADADEATGILTHHLILDAACDEFLADLIACVDGHPAVRWIAIDEAL
jgi:hypothetical protein